MHSPTESEYEAFPPVLKRKFFSAEERLRYAQAQARAEAKARPPLSPCRRLGKALTIPANQLAVVSKVKPSLILHHHPLLRRPSSRQRKSPPPALTTKDISQADALWFSRLPDKVKRGHFSREEQLLLAGKQSDDTVDAAAKKLYNLDRRPIHRSTPSPPSFHSRVTSPASSLGSAEFDSLAGDSDSDDFESLETEEDMDEEMMTSFRWLDEDEPDLALDYYDAHFAEVQQKAKGESAQPNYRRNRSLTTFSFAKDIRTSIDNRRTNGHQSHLSRTSMDRWGGSRNSGDAPPLPPLPAPLKITLSKPLPSERTEHYFAETSTSSVTSASDLAQEPAQQQRQSTEEDSEAKQYLNQEARLKLRLFLATPSRFDEALEFGIPSPQPQTRPRASTSFHAQSAAISQSLNRQFTNQPAQLQEPMTFFNDDKYTDLNSPSEPARTLSIDSRPCSSVYSLSHPATPGPNSPTLAAPTTLLSGVPQGWIDPTHDYSDDADQGPPSFSSSSSSPSPSYQREWPAREPTVRMTLTRPDLRAQEGGLYPDAAPHPFVVKRMAGLTRSSPSPDGGPIGGVGGSGSIANKASPRFRNNEPISLEELAFDFDDVLRADDEHRRPKEKGIWKLLTRRR